MSFILDALKKSERERQRQTGPALFEVKVAPPRNRFPVWAVVIGALLLVNIGVVAWLLLHNASKTDNSSDVDTGNPQSAASPQGSASRASTPQWPPPSEEYGGSPASFDGNNGAFQRGRPQQEPSWAQRFDEPSLRDDSAAEAGVLNPEDYEPATEPGQKPGAASSAAEESAEEKAARRASSGLPSYQDATAQGLGLPEMRLDLHVYDDEADKSFVFVNMQKLKQGDSFGPGVRVDRITPDGAILSFRGVRFVLRKD